MDEDNTKSLPVIRDARLSLSEILPLPTILAYIIIAFFVYSFFSGLTYKFYASVLFWFYSLIGRMWIAVVGLGVFQVLIMIPFRIVNLKISSHINEFKEKTEELKSEQEQSFLVRRQIKRGDRPLLFYMIDFVVQLTSYMSIGRLFLTDFYSMRIDPKLLFSFVPYPEYPIQARIFKIPYPAVTRSVDLGVGVVLVVWLAIVLFQFAIYFYKYVNRKVEDRKYRFKLPTKVKSYAKLVSGNAVILMVVSWIIFRRFPVGWTVRIFSGDISIPNRTFNTITAIVTFGLVVWFGSAKISRKSKLAIAQKVSKEVIFKTQKEMFKQTLRSATLVGLGAYFITRQIPSAFELSIFTFEMIALLSPFTLDRLIMSTV
jgi:hypothetical protein